MNVVKNLGAALSLVLAFSTTAYAQPEVSGQESEIYQVEGMELNQIDAILSAGDASETMHWRDDRRSPRRPRYHECAVRDRRGYHYRGIGRNVRQAARRALRQCFQYSNACEIVACR